MSPSRAICVSTIALLLPGVPGASGYPAAAVAGTSRFPARLPSSRARPVALQGAEPRVLVDVPAMRQLAAEAATASNAALASALSALQETVGQGPAQLQSFLAAEAATVSAAVSSSVPKLTELSLPSAVVPSVDVQALSQLVSEPEALSRLSSGLMPALSSAVDALDGLNGLDLLSKLDAAALTQAAPAAAAVLLAAAFVGRGGDTSKPYPNRVYDPDSAARYFRRRPLVVAARSLELLARSAGFGALLLGDLLRGKLDEKADERAVSLARLLTTLGPTFIKAGQSASIRTDLLPPPYIRGLTQLQDQVPPFPTDEALAILRHELGSAAERLFPRGLPATPVAAASLGQVYKGELDDGRAVAVKVQRPQMDYQIALDMHLIRDYLAPAAKVLGVPGDLVGTADVWGEGFVAELDYEQEAANAGRFTEEIAGSALEGKVFAPTVVGDASTARVLTTEWVVGERLDQAANTSDVPRLCSVAMIAYLSMMLDSGTLHCDPHPGNLLRTADGRLCILDWGLISTIDSELQLTLIEHVAHLTAADYAKVPSDLVKLGFVPEGAEQVVADNGVVDFLTYTYSTWSSGGGATKLDVPKLFATVRELASDTDDGLFQVPPYFAYIAKSFSVLEGIGLSIDPNYSIVGETLPYISQRIITDPSPRTAGALQTFVFGEAKEDVTKRVLDPERVETLLDGAKRYMAAVGEGPSMEVDVAAELLLDVLVERDETPLQALVLEQVALVLAAGTRQSFAQLRESSGRLGAVSSAAGTDGGGRPRSALGLLVDPLGLFRDSPLVLNDARDEAALEAARQLASSAADLFPRDAGTAPPTPADSQELVRKLATKVWERREQLPLLTRRLAVKVLDQTSQRLDRGRL